MIGLFDEPAVRTVALGTAAIGTLAGFIGTFAVVRRQSLLGDAISHAALPGLALAFLLGARSPIVLIAGAAVAGWIAIALVAGLVRGRHASFDTALGGALAVFFGIGLALLTAIQKHIPDATRHGLDRYLFGQAAIMDETDVRVVAAVGLISLGIVLALWKPIQLLCFDPDFAAVQGWPIRRLDALLAALVVVATVTGLQAVGVVLMSSLLVAPAVAARQWLNRLGPMAALAAAFGGIAGFAGTIGSHLLSKDNRTVPTGPVIVLVATALVAISLARSLFARRVIAPAGATS